MSLVEAVGLGLFYRFKFGLYCKGMSEENEALFRYICWNMPSVNCSDSFMRRLRFRIEVKKDITHSTDWRTV